MKQAGRPAGEPDKAWKGEKAVKKQYNASEKGGERGETGDEREEKENMFRLKAAERSAPGEA